MMEKELQIKFTKDILNEIKNLALLFKQEEPAVVRDGIKCLSDITKVKRSGTLVLPNGDKFRIIRN